MPSPHGIATLVSSCMGQSNAGVTKDRPTCSWIEARIQKWSPLFQYSEDMTMFWHPFPHVHLSPISSLVIGCSSPLFRQLLLNPFQCSASGKTAAWPRLAGAGTSCPPQSPGAARTDSAVNLSRAGAMSPGILYADKKHAKLFNL